MTIENYAPHTGRFLKEDDTAVNMADILEGIGTKSATIALGASESGVIDLEGYQLAVLHMSSAWTTADITFLAADVADGVYQPLYYAGQEVKEKVAANQCITPENYIPLASVRFLKIRSGTSSTPVAQAATREIKITVKR